MGVNCGCEKGIYICPDADKLWRAYLAAEEVERELFHKVAEAGETSPIIYDRWRLSGDLKRAARRLYERHVDQAGEPVPEPQSLRAVE